MSCTDTDFLISLLCPVLGNLAEETIDCGPDAVIDVIWARLALLGSPNRCDRNFDDIAADIIKDNPGLFPCLTDLPFVG